MKYLWLAILLICFDGLGQSNCKLQLERDSIKVYTCPVKDSKYKALKVEFQLNATYSQVAKMILDIDNLHRWQYKTESVTLLKRISERELIYHTEVQTPFVTNNRDFVIHLTVNQNQKTKELTIKAISQPDYIPVEKKVVRVPFSEAVWQIKSIEKNKLSVVYNIQIDFGGAIPAWVVNSLSHVAPYETFKAMQQQIGRYKDAHVTAIVD